MKNINCLLFGSTGKIVIISGVDFELVKDRYLGRDKNSYIAIYKENVLITTIDLHSLRYEMSNAAFDEIHKYYTIC